MTAEGSVGDFDDAKRDSLKSSIAAVAGVDASAVTVAITPGSVIITATIAVPASKTAAAVQSSLATRLGLEEGERLPRSIVEYYYKADHLNDPMVTEEHITAFGWATIPEIDEILNMSIRVNDFLSGLFLGIGLKLVDFKLEFGRVFDEDQDMIILADEISPDNCRLWDVKTNEKLDKDRFRRDMGRVEEAYQEVARRLGILPEDPGREVAETPTEEDA